MSRRARVRGLALVVGLCGAGRLWLGAAPEPSPPPAIVCRHAVMIDGLVRCGPPPRSGELCGDASVVFPEPIRPGDAVQTRAICRDRLPRRGESGWSRMPPAALAALDQPVYVNEASVDELASLPGIGPAIARRIVERRPYRSVDELLEVRGIGPGRLDRVRARARIDASGDPSR